MDPEASTQVSFANFPNDVQARDLALFLEQEVGLVLRCKVKVTRKLPPHAFVQFESPTVAKEAVKMADKGRLIFRKVYLKARMDLRAWSHGQRGLNAKTRKYIQLVDVTLELGTITGPKSMHLSWCCPGKCLVRLEPEGNRLRFFFTQDLQISSRKTRCDVMMKVGLQDVKEVREVEREVNPVLLLQLLSPPAIFYRTAEDDIYEFYEDPSQLVEDDDPWIRCLDIVTPDRSIGRCLDYRIMVSARQRTAFMKMVAYCKKHNILHKSIQAAFAVSWETLVTTSTAIGCHFFTVPHQRDIPFDIMYLVNTLVNQGTVPATSLSPAFYDLLRLSAASPREAVAALKHMLTYKDTVFEPTRELESVLVKVKQLESARGVDEEPQQKNGVEVNNHRYMLVWRLTITPTRVKLSLPEIERTNRVLRHYSRLSDRFLRVCFMDEDGRSIGSSSLSVQYPEVIRDSGFPAYTRTDLYERVLSILRDGFAFCGREYQFLAFSAGQLRESSAWFFATDGYTHVQNMREWMGTFPGGNVAKHAARMGQCFSATFASMQVRHQETLTLPDIKRNGYDFSDGCGKISPELAQDVAASLNLECCPPSAYQIRYSGYKGVVAVWPIEADSGGGGSSGSKGAGGSTLKLGLRESMNKFISTHRQLEIVGWSKFLPCFLNRQIITLLSTLYVDDSVFVKLQDMMVGKLNRMVVDRDLAYSFLIQTCSGELYSTALRMLCSGFNPRTESHLKSMLVAIRAGQLEDLLHKARIFVPNGRWLLGCLDERAVLEYGQCFLRVTNPQGPQDMLTSRAKVITGTVVMAKNPCMHPGDVRVLQAVDNPELHHLVDCLVFPQNGPRPHTNEASGSDLDGDVYFVSWDESLIPPSGQSWTPMEYETPSAKVKRSPVTIGDVIEFFARHMVNDSLGKICNAHVVRADRSKEGAMHRDCLFLAELAAKAVDYPKTGKAAIMPHEYKPSKYPDFMQKEDALTYISEKIIGRLFRSIQDTAIEASQQSKGQYRIPEPEYDPDLEVRGFEAHVEEAWLLKQAYDQQIHAIMTQFGIDSEGEVVTGHVRAGPKGASSRKRGDTKERVKNFYEALQKEYSALLCPFQLEPAEQQDNDRDGGDIGTDAVASSLRDIPEELLQARASAWYYVTYNRDYLRRAREGPHVDAMGRPLLSFAWLAIDQLATIKAKKLKLAKGVISLGRKKIAATPDL